RSPARGDPTHRPASFVAFGSVFSRCVFSQGLLGGLLRRGLLFGGLGFGSLGFDEFRVVGGRLDEVFAGVLGFLGLQGAFCAVDTFELLPVPRHLEQREDRFGGLGAHAEPILCPLTVDVDEGRLFGRVVLPDLLDDPAVPLLAGVDDNDTVEGRADFPKALQTNSYSHVFGYSLFMVVNLKPVLVGSQSVSVRGRGSVRVRGPAEVEYSLKLCPIRGLVCHSDRRGEVWFGAHRLTSAGSPPGRLRSGGGALRRLPAGRRDRRRRQLGHLR